MHILFVHQNFPAQFGHVADYLCNKHGYRCTFVSEKPAAKNGNFERLQYQVKGGATQHNHYCSRTFENAIWHTHAVQEALKARPDVRPDLVVGHSGFGSTLFLRDLYPCPVVNYFEYFYRPKDSDMDFRPEFPPEEIDCMRARARNATILLDLENCNLGYSPTHWQRDRLPELFHDKVRVIFDGIDTTVWKPQPNAPRQIDKLTVPKDTRIVTYVSRGLESMRGFDIFMQVAKRLCDCRQDVIFLVVGQDRICYGGDRRITGEMTFKEWVLSKDKYDLSRVHFLGLVPPKTLAHILALSDLHVYLTAPFVLSWSLMNALACGCTVLASDTAPVQEMITHGENGLLANFFDVEGLTRTAYQVLSDPGKFRPLGKSAAEGIRSKYDLELCLPQMMELYEAAAKLGVG